MLIIPAIDLKGGKCVRLRRGNMNEVTVFSGDPLATAARWVEAGAKRLHIVDLDGAAMGKPAHVMTVTEIAGQFPDLVIQVGGGIRDEEMVQEYLNRGVQFVVLGTRAVTQPHVVRDLCLEFPGHIIVGLDMRDGKVATAGWSKLSHHDALDMARHFEGDGVAAIVFTDISRDGMMSGVNVKSTNEIASAVNIPVIAAGGVSSMDDVKTVCAESEEGIVGLIVGRALYEGTVDLKAAQKLADDLSAD